MQQRLVEHGHELDQLVEQVHRPASVVERDVVRTRGHVQHRAGRGPRCRRRRRPGPHRYVLTGDGKTSLPCTDDSGCTKAWPDLAVPDGMSAPSAGQGVQASLLGTEKEGDEAYATYNKWPLYEFAGDGAAGQANGQGIKSFGGTWYALDASGNPVMKTASDRRQLQFRDLRRPLQLTDRSFGCPRGTKSWFPGRRGG